jgi:hypothetical protein
MNKDLLHRFAKDFVQDFQLSAEIKAHAADHSRRKQRAHELLTTQRIPTLSEDDLRQLFFDTDAFGFWTKKEWEFNKRLHSSGLEGLRESLSDLIASGEKGLKPEDLQRIWDKRGLGILLTTELLTHRFPDSYWTFNANVTLAVLQGLGEDIKNHMPRGQKSTAYLYFAVQVPIDETRQALQEAGLPQVDYSTADIFLWWVKSNNRIDTHTPARLANVLQSSQRTAQTLKITYPFLESISTLLQEKIGPIRVDVGVRTRSIPKNEYQFLDRAYFALEESGQPLSDSKALILSVLVQKNRIWWGFTKHGSLAESQYLEQTFRDLGLIRPSELSVRGEGSYGATEAWQRGFHYSLGHELKTEEVTAQTDMDAFAEQIASDLAEMYQRIQPHMDKLHRAIERAEQESDTHLPQVWIFQANPKYYDLPTDLKNSKIGSRDSWSVTAYRNEIHEGDTVLLWSSGKMAGIYAVGRLINNPYQWDKPADIAENELKPFDKAKWKVGFEYSYILSQPILREKIKNHPILMNLNILKIANATNFKVKPEEWNVLQEMIWDDKSMDGDGNCETKGTFDLPSTIEQYFASTGLMFSTRQIATFYTALQTKGFVILSGISGTGKTKLAQGFAALLPQPATPLPSQADKIQITIQPYMLRYSRVIIPKASTRFFDPPPPGETRPVQLTFDGGNETCKLQHASYVNTNYIQVLLKGKARAWLTDSVKEGDELLLEPSFDKENSLTGFHMTAGNQADPTPAEPGKGQVGGQNWLFVPVRPDWRDSKSILGYYNPLTATYQWTEFLRFLLRAVRSYQVKDGLAWFVILDEMNLARVEYYFADLLSVLESGRNKDGWTRESLCLSYPDEAEGDLPPDKVYLPPNLYIVGTVNVDETTHAFSPKVLDRAFTLELTEASFNNYPPTLVQEMPLTSAQRRSVLQNFTANGSFAVFYKEAIAGYVQRNPAIRNRLQTLNQALENFELHFGFRVFDEIVAFLISAECNGLYTNPGGQEAALDAAVQMKILPKFHGSRGKLEGALLALLAWCVNSDVPDQNIIEECIKTNPETNQVREELAKIDYHYPYTARRALRMLWQLYTTGFAAFN